MFLQPASADGDKGASKKGKCATCEKPHMSVGHKMATTAYVAMTRTDLFAVATEFWKIRE